MGISNKSKKQETVQNKYRSEKSSDKIVQKQVGGEGANLYQAGIVNVYQGITEERARSIFVEMMPQVLELYSNEAAAIANSRIQELESELISRMINIDDSFSAFSDPAFQIQLKKAQMSAAATERADDYSLLSELLVSHAKNGNDRKKRTGITKAIEVVDNIDYGALCALTIVYALSNYKNTNCNIEEGIAECSKMLTNLLYTDLPVGNEWIEHLDMLGAVRIVSSSDSSFSTSRSSSLIQEINVFSFVDTGLNLYKHYLSNKAEAEKKALESLLLPYIFDYACKGIKINSKDYKKACGLLKEIGLSSEFLITHEFLEGYVRLPVHYKEEIPNLVLETGNQEHKASLFDKISVLGDIWESYSRDDCISEAVQNESQIIYETNDAIKKISSWMDQFSQCLKFSITEAGAILAYSNAKRCDPSLADKLQNA